MQPYKILVSDENTLNRTLVKAIFSTICMDNGNDGRVEKKKKTPVSLCPSSCK